MSTKTLFLAGLLLFAGCIASTAQQKNANAKTEHPKEVSYHAPQYNAAFQSLAKKYNDLRYVILDLPFSVEEEQDINFHFSDLLIIQRADSILSDTSAWDRHDDRQCRNENAGKYSLFCALAKASQEVAGEYLHRRAVMQEVRFMIVKYYRNRFNHHRLMDFNNNPETTLKDIHFVLQKSGEVIRKQLEEKQEILNVVHKLMDDINRKGFSTARNLYSEKSSEHYLLADQDSIISGKRIPFFMSKTPSNHFCEKISGLISISVDKNMGTATVPCRLWSGEKLLYHGEEELSFIKAKNGWKITAINYSIQDN